MFLPGTAAATHELADAIAEAAHLTSYRYTKHQSSPQRPRDVTLHLVTTAGKLPAAKHGVLEGTIEAEAAMLARDLVNEPPSLLTPRHLAAAARRIGRASGLTVSVLGKKQMERLGFNATLAVAKGSDEEPCFIKVSYAPRRAKKHVVLVGKGVTYDAGGINIKPTRGGSLEDMKMDMAGAAAVLATLSALPRRKIPVKVTAYVAATENLLGGSAYKPGDVVRAYNRKSIEITNTDAEGRLTLADALSYAVAKDKPDVIIDLATLTGAAIVALGDKIAALFSNNDELARALWKASKQSGERIWKLPLPHDYNEMIKGRIADLDNSGASGAGTITAALFLQNFVGTTPWAHLDIAGPAFASKDSGYLARGGTGFGVRLLLEYLESLE
jgi:leucyl aminopeptidase